MKENQQLGQALFKMSEGKRKQLFSHLLNEFRNSKVNLSEQAHNRGGEHHQNHGMSTLGPSHKTNKKKSSSIDKKYSVQPTSNLIQTTISKKGTQPHKKTKSHLNSNIAEAIKDHKNYNTNPPGYLSQVPSRKVGQMASLEHSYAQNSMNKSYEKMLSETVQVQNTGSGGYHHPQINKHNNQYEYQLALQAANAAVAKQKHNLTLQFNTSLKRQSGSTNVSQTRYNKDSSKFSAANYSQGYNSNKSSRKSLSNTKYDQQSKKRSRRTDQLYNGQQARTKCESNRTSKKNSPNSTITAISKGTFGIRGARTKPTSPERSFMMVNSLKKPLKKAQGNAVVTGSQIANQREEIQAMNMITSIGKKNDIRISTHGAHGAPTISACSKNTKERLNQRSEFNSIQSNTQKRKNFKNIFYSPSNGRDAFTEPHSKIVSQAQTKEHSPINRDKSNLAKGTGAAHIQSYQPKIRAKVKPPTQLKSKALYQTKDSSSKHSKMQTVDRADIEFVPHQSFLEESYVHHNIPTKKNEDYSFDSVQNQFSQTGTPLSYKIKLQAQNVKNPKNLNIAYNSNGTMDKKGSKVISYPHTTGLQSKNQSQFPSPVNATKRINQGNQVQQKFRYQSEAPSPVSHQGLTNVKQMFQPQKKRGFSNAIEHSEHFADSLAKQKVAISLKGKPLALNNPVQKKQGSTSQSQQQQFLFNQYLNSKKQRHNYDSNDCSLERKTQEPFGDSKMGKSFKNENVKISKSDRDSPRSQEVDLIKSLIQECFKKYKKPPKTQIELYKIGKMLGKGAFGKVNMGLHRLTRKLVAIKAINMEFMKDESSKKKMSNEITILKALRHPNVVKLLETFEIEKHHLIVMELCPGGDLLNYVRKRRKLNEKYAKFVFQQIMQGLLYLHQNGVVHRDIKLDNILLDGHGNIKIADFGVSRQVVDNEILFEQCGTPAYIAPEIVRELGYKGYPVDMWSAGVCLYAMLYGNVPFKANQMGDLNKMILDSQIEYKDTASEPARDLMQRMLQKNPGKRLTAAEALEHPWFDDVDEQLDIFDEQELDLIRKEFTYVTQQKKLKELKDRKAEDLNTEFTEHSINETENTLLRNNSSRSVILCPFNTQNGQTAKSLYDDIKEMLVDKDMIIRFHVRAREKNREYEKFNNQDFDNGVYHKYAYNQGKNKEGEGQDGLREETIENDEVSHKNLVGRKRQCPDTNFQNYYLKKDEGIIEMVEEYGFPKPFVVKCLNENVNNHCTTTYYLLCMDQNY